MQSELQCESHGQHCYVVWIGKNVVWIGNKSDISYLKTSRAFDVLIHSSQTLLVSDSVGTTSSCSLLSGVSALGQPRVVASASRYPSRSRNCGRLLIAAMQSSRLSCRSRLVRLHGNNVRDHIQTRARGNCKVILGRFARSRLVKMDITS